MTNLLKNYLDIPKEVDLLHPINFYAFLTATLQFVNDNPQFRLMVVPIKVDNENYIEEYLKLTACTWIRICNKEEAEVMKKYLKGVSWVIKQ